MPCFEFSSWPDFASSSGTRTAGTEESTDDKGASGGDVSGDRVGGESGGGSGGESGGESGGGVDDGVFYGGSFGRASEGAQTAVTVATAAEAAAEVAPRGGMGYGCPRGSQLVAIEMGGEPLETFVHPERAIYILGSEDTGLADSIVQAAHHHVALPSVRYESYNVAMAGSIVLYDRLAKQATGYGRREKNGKKGTGSGH